MITDDNMQREDILRFLFRTINRLVPKKKNQIVFHSIPDFEDNANSLFRYMQDIEEIHEKYSMIWLITNKKFLKKLKQKNIKAYEKFSLKGLYCLLRSKYIFVTHNTFITLKSENQILINLWHGMPLKSMLFTDKSEDNHYLGWVKKFIDNVDIFVATSPVMKIALASCFFTDPRKIYLTGQPRNDKLFDKNVKQTLSDLTNIDVSEYEKIILYCPTFRISKKYIDGVPLKMNIFNFEYFDDKIFEDLLIKNKVLFLLKFHPFEEKIFLSEFSNKKSSNIIFITNEMLQEKFLDLYDILGAVDILITDYSSVYFDFLLLNRPIIFTPTDIEEYSKKRGLVLEPYDFWAPGPKAINIEKFLFELKKCIENPDYFGKERELVNNIINKYNDNKSCERVYNLIFGN